MEEDFLIEEDLVSLNTYLKEIEEDLKKVSSLIIPEEELKAIMDAKAAEEKKSKKKTKAGGKK